MIRLFLVLLLIISSAPIVAARVKDTKKKEEEIVVKVAGVPTPKPKSLKKRVKWWNIWIYKNKMPELEIVEYRKYIEKLKKEAAGYRAHEESLRKPRREWLDYYTKLEASYQKTIDILTSIINTRIEYSRVKGSVRPDNVKKRKAAEETLQKLCKDFKKSVLNKPSRPK